MNIISIIKNIRVARSSYNIFKVVADGAILNTQLGEGRLLPVVIIDTRDNAEAKEVIKAHASIVSGDVNLLWSRPLFSISSVILVLEFLKPIKVKFGVEFDIKSQSILVDSIIKGRGMYLSAGQPTDRASDFSKSKILIEVPDLDFDSIWEDILLKNLTRKYKYEGLSTNDSKQAARVHITNMRIFSQLRKS